MHPNDGHLSCSAEPFWLTPRKASSCNLQSTRKTRNKCVTPATHFLNLLDYLVCSWTNLPCVPKWHVCPNAVLIPVLFGRHKVHSLPQQADARFPKQPAMTCLLFPCLPLAFTSCCPRTLWVVYLWSGTSWCAANVHICLLGNLRSVYNCSAYWQYHCTKKCAAAILHVRK